jgi:hypothetical protein
MQLSQRHQRSSMGAGWALVLLSLLLIGRVEATATLVEGTDLATCTQSSE